MSDDVNDYLHEVSGEEITAKDFRTWAATNLAALALRDREVFDTPARAKKHLVEVVEHVAQEPGQHPGRSAASATSTRRCSRATWTAAWWNA